MKKSRFNESQIFKILKDAENGLSAIEVCRQYGISQATFYKWKAKYSGMELSMLKRLRELERENKRLKRMYADSKMGTEILKEALEKNFDNGE